MHRAPGDDLRVGLFDDVSAVVAGEVGRQVMFHLVEFGMILHGDFGKFALAPMAFYGNLSVVQSSGRVRRRWARLFSVFGRFFSDNM